MYGAKFGFKAKFSPFNDLEKISDNSIIPKSCTAKGDKLVTASNSLKK